MLVRKIIHPWRNPSVATRKIEKNAPSDSLHYSCYTSSPLQAPSRHQTILKQVISCGRWVPPALDSSLTPCDKLGDSRFGPPHTHSSKCLGTLTGFLEENVPAYFSKNRRKLEGRLHSRTLGRTTSAAQTVKSDPYILLLSAKHWATQRQALSYFSYSLVQNLAWSGGKSTSSLDHTIAESALGKLIPVR